ncbi:MAG: biotin/lipoyl-binding protein [Anaerolineae bacterium]
MKRILYVLLILVVMAGGGLFGYQYLAQAQESKAQENSTTTVKIGRKTLEKTVSASGSIEPLAEVEMKFETGGTVAEVLVKEGQTITAGTVLARLDTSDLELQVRSAKIDLTQAQANLAKLYEPELAEKIAAAKAKVESARLTLADLQDGPDADEVTKAEAALAKPESPLRKSSGPMIR